MSQPTWPSRLLRQIATFQYPVKADTLEALGSTAQIVVTKLQLVKCVRQIVFIFQSRTRAGIEFYTSLQTRGAAQIHTTARTALRSCLVRIRVHECLMFYESSPFLSFAFHDKASTVLILVCASGLPQAACLGNNTCAKQYDSTSERCSKCASKYYRLNDRCQSCPDAPWLIFVGLFIIGCMATYTGYLLAKKEVKLTVTHVRLCTLRAFLCALIRAYTYGTFPYTCVRITGLHRCTERRDW
jgi:hypothetical protein